MRHCVLLLLAAVAFGQQRPFEFDGQITTISQTHGPFRAPYSGTNSLRSVRETDTSLTATLFLTLRFRNTEIGFTPEVAGGAGFSGVLGIAGFPNGEIPRVGKPTPTPYIGRLYWKQRVSRFTWVAGKLAAPDFFDGNVFSHDPRTQFQNWAIMYNGAWDYPADTRGYTIGAVQELHFESAVVRIGSFLEPSEANGMKLDYHVASNHGDAMEVQLAYPHGGVARAMAFVNHGNMGTYRAADRDIGATRKPGTIKYGFGLNLEQSLTASIGVFGRLGWNDGKTESWAFTEIDRSASGGVSIRGNGWRRPGDVLGFGAAINGISGDHRAYLARGGAGFLIGDGSLAHPGREEILEAYYAWRIQKMVTISPDYQFIANPAYNRDRGPVHVISLRLHVER